MLLKRLIAPLSFKADGPEGSVQSLFSVFNKLDEDGDVVLPSFFQDGQAIPMAAWGHDWGSLPPGKGIVRVTPEGAIFDGQFFTDTTAGRDHYLTVKHMGELQEWSFGFKVTDSERGTFEGKPARFLKSGETFEASPVLVGANRDTATLSIKARKQSYLAVELEGSYEDLAEDIAEAWGGMATTVATYPGYAVVCVPDPNSYEPVYWRVAYTLDASGDPVLGERTQVEAQAVFAPSDEPALSFAGAMKRLGARASGLTALRLKEGRAISERRRQQIADMADALQGHADTLRAMHTETAPPQKQAAATELARFLAFEARRNGVMA